MTDETARFGSASHKTALESAEEDRKTGIQVVRGKACSNHPSRKEKGGQDLPALVEIPLQRLKSGLGYCFLRANISTLPNPSITTVAGSGMTEDATTNTSVLSM